VADKASRPSHRPTFFTSAVSPPTAAVSDRAIRNWIGRGELPSYELGASGRIYLADVDDVLARYRDEES
jgi:hypothetical protein